MENDSISDRLKALRERSGYSVRALAALLELPPSTYVNYEHRFKKPYLPMDFVKSLVAALSDQIPESEIMELAGVQAPERVENGESGPARKRLIPVFDLSASAGHGSLTEYEIVAYSLAFPPEYLSKVTQSHPRHLAIISVNGDSMEPALKDNDIVMVDTSKKNVGYDGMFVLQHMGVLKVKRIRLSRDGQIITIISTNPLYQPEDCRVDDIEIIGRVIWSGGKT